MKRRVLLPALAASAVLLAVAAANAQAGCCEPAACAPAACAAACEPCGDVCGAPRCGLLDRLKARCAARKACCEPATCPGRLRSGCLRAGCCKPACARRCLRGCMRFACDACCSPLRPVCPALRARLAARHACCETAWCSGCLRAGRLQARLRAVLAPAVCKPAYAPLLRVLREPACDARCAPRCGLIARL